MATTTLAGLPLVVRTVCSGCMEAVTVRLTPGTVTVRVPSNGKRGSLHQPAHDLTDDLESDDGDLVTWTCPSCGHADSYDLNYGG
jgi:RNase P subunit RPR2